MGVEGLIPAGVDIGEDISLQITLSRGSTIEVLNRVFDTSLIKANNRWRNMEGGGGGEVGEGLRMLVTYTQVENALGMHLRYSRIL